MTDPGAPAQPAAPRPSAVLRAALPRELSDFLIELSIALHKHAMYPGGHPELAPSSHGVARRLESLLAERGTLSLGVAREQLVIEGLATDPRHPVLKDLAKRLHRHHLGALSFARGVSGEEIDQSLKLLAEDASRGGEPIGLRPRGKIPIWPHIRLYPLSFDRLQLLDAPDGGAQEGDDLSPATRAQSAQLWLGLAQAALAAEEAEPPVPVETQVPSPEPKAPLSEAEIDAALDVVEAAAPMEVTAAEPVAVAEAIEAHQRGTAYDQVIVGYMLQIADELKMAGGTGAVALRKRMSKLISALDETTLSRLLDMGGDLAQRRQFILDASQGMAADSVVDLVRAASGAGAPISQSMLRMLTKLGHHAERGGAAREIAEANLRDQIAELVQEWALTDPNPDGYSSALEKMAQASPALLTPGEAQFIPEPARLLQMACETGATGDAVLRAVDQLVLEGRLAEAFEVVDRAPRPSPASEAIAARAATPESVRVLLASQPVDLVLLDRVLAHTDDAAADPMLDSLATSEARQLRRALLDRLIRIGPPLGPHLLPRLADERWYVVRNLLHLAAELPAAPAGLNAAQYAQHGDLRVRREALRVLFKDPAERARAICTALADEEPRVKRLALAAAADAGCPEPAVPLVVALATGDEELELRVAAIRTLATAGGPLALDALLRLTHMRRSVLGNVKRVESEPEFLAALGALGRFAADHRARQRLEQAATSKDAETAKVAGDALRGVK